MQLDFAEVLLQVVDRRASDLHLTSGAPPMVRIRGRLTALEGYPALTPTDTREIVYSILSNSQRQKLETNWQLDFAYQIPGAARFRVNAYFQRTALGAAFRLIPFEVVPLEQLGLPPAVAEFANKPRGLVLVTGPDRVRQVDDARVAGRCDQRDPRRAHHDDRGPDRVPAPPQEVHRQPAGVRGGRDQLRRGAEGRAAPGPGRDPRRRDARPRDDRDRDHGGRDRPPRVRDPAHPGHAADDRPDRRRVPARPAGSGTRAAVGRAPGDHDPDAAADRRRRRPLRRRRGAGPDPGGPQPDPRGEVLPDLLGAADRRGPRDADDGLGTRAAHAPGHDHAPAGRVSRALGRGAAPADRWPRQRA